MDTPQKPQQHVITDCESASDKSINHQFFATKNPGMRSRGLMFLLTETLNKN